VLVLRLHLMQSNQQLVEMHMKAHILGPGHNKVKWLPQQQREHLQEGGDPGGMGPPHKDILKKGTDSVQPQHNAFSKPSLSLPVEH
ncbi:hypothetical protein C0995_001993, partial [Termitomyces sp. Mi166